MLHQLGLANFKSFGPERTDLTFGRITILIGPNGVGKSSVLQALLLLKQSVIRGYLDYTGPLIDLGPFKDLVHGQNAQSRVEIWLLGQYSSSPAHPMKTGVVQSEFAYNLIFGKAGVDRQSIELTSSAVPDIPITALSSQTMQNVNPRVIQSGELNITLEPSAKFAELVTVRPTSASLPSDILGDVLDSLSPVPNVLSSYFLTPAIRGFDARAYEVAPSPLHSNPSQPHRGADDARFVANLIAERPDIVEAVSDSVNFILNRKGSFRYRLDLGRIVVELKKGKMGVNLLHEAFGLNQLIAPLITFFAAPPGSVIAVEEPEIHLHPGAQAALSTFFTHATKQEGKQLLLTTHSEHILMGFLTAVANGDLMPEELAVYELRADDGTTSATRLTVNEYGQIEGGLRGFMEVDLDEIGDFIKARIAHQAQ